MIKIEQQFLTTVGGIKVERILDCKRSHQNISKAQEPNAVQHTTEGHFGPSLARFKVDTGTPTFMLGYNILKVVNGKLTNQPAASNTKIRVAQFMPIGEMALTLKNAAGGTETNREAVVQIELVGTCVVGANGFDEWLPPEPVLKVLSDLYRQIEKACGVPLQRGGNGTRSVALWDGRAGWFGHGEVPENDHSDPRRLKYAEIFKRAAPKQKLVWQIKAGEGKLLFQTQAKMIDGKDGLDRVARWQLIEGNQEIMRRQEVEHGHIRIRKVMVSE